MCISTYIYTRPVNGHEVVSIEYVRAVFAWEIILSRHWANQQDAYLIPVMRITRIGNGQVSGVYGSAKDCLVNETKLYLNIFKELTNRINKWILFKWILKGLILGRSNTICYDLSIYIYINTLSGTLYFDWRTIRIMRLNVILDHSAK